MCFIGYTFWTLASKMPTAMSERADVNATEGKPLTFRKVILLCIVNVA